MPSCKFCDHDNPAGAKRCASCGAELPGAMENESREYDALERGETPAPLATASSGVPSGVLDALRQGNKIEAIKLYRKQTGLGLKEAKDAVEALAARHGIVSKSGCASVLAAAVGIGWVVLEFVA
jgi:hypothetical protein